jgi:ectoine hydroxylase-related dioxygenase (phytanoyl-CoA dioxygenase family)
VNLPKPNDFRPLPTVAYEPTITDEAVERYHQLGFTWIDRITSDEEVEWLVEIFDHLFTEKLGGVAGGYFDLSRPYDAEGSDMLPQVLVPERIVPDLVKTTFRRNARTIASRLLGVDPGLLDVWGHMIYKPPRIGHITPWHQDEAYWDPGLEYDALGAWLALDDVDLENGCMCFLPASHRSELLPHRHINDDPAVHGLETTVDVDESQMVHVPLRAGGATFHHARTLHSTPPNRSDRPRRAFASEYQTAPRARQHPVERPWFTDGQAAWDERPSIQSADS